MNTENVLYDELFDMLVEHQEKKLLACAQSIMPSANAEDIRQPNDFPQLELHPYFRYEEGILEGLRTARMAYRAEKMKDKCHE